MKQRTAFLLAIALTAFVAVLVLGIGGATSLLAAQSAQTSADSADTAQAPATPDPATATPEMQQLPSNVELVSFEGTPAYEVRLSDGALYIDAATGEVLYDSRMAVTDEIVLREAAAPRAAGQRIAFDEDHDDGHDEEHEAYEEHD